MIDGWNSDAELEQYFAQEDKELFEKLDILLKRTNRREDEVGGLTKKLNREIRGLDSYLTQMIGKGSASTENDGNNSRDINYSNISNFTNQTFNSSFFDSIKEELERL